MSERTTTLRQAADEYVKHLRAAGKADPTVRSYAGDLEMAVRFFGAEKQMAKFLKVHVKRFLDSEPFNKRRSGTPKNEVTVRKSRRAIRQFFEWAVAQGYMAEVPVATPPARSRETVDGQG
jgi:site-specific recombinase XerD